MKRRTIGLIVTLALGLLAAPLAADAQPPAKVARIGLLDYAPFCEPFRQGLPDLGYAEGQNIIIEYRPMEGRRERLPDLAAELVCLKLDVIVTFGAVATLAAKHVTTAIPIIMVGVGDPLRLSFEGRNVSHRHNREVGCDVELVSLCQSTDCYPRTLEHCCPCYPSPPAAPPDRRCTRPTAAVVAAAAPDCLRHRRGHCGRARIRAVRRRGPRCQHHTHAQLHRADAGAERGHLGCGFDRLRQRPGKIYRSADLRSSEHT